MRRSDMSRFNTPEVREKVYLLLTAAFVVASVYGVFTDEQITAFLGVIAAAMGVLAALNVPTKARLERQSKE
jgi:hypothetical protein